MSCASRNLSASARAKAAAKKAVLEAETAALKRLHSIEEEEIRLRQCKDALKLETEMAKAKAEEFGYTQAEKRESHASLEPANSQIKPNTSAPHQPYNVEVHKLVKLNEQVSEEI